MDTIDVLAIDDDKIVQKIINKALEPNGFIVRPAFDGESGLVAASEQTPDLILLDVEMPGMNGYEVCERLVEQEKFKHVPIVFLSSHGSLRERMQGYEIGADDYIVKPFERDDLIARIRILMRYAEQAKALYEQYKVAHKTAMTAMTGSSELGLAIGYMEKSLSYTSLHETALGLLEVTERLSLDCRLMILCGEQKHWFSSNGGDVVSPLEKELIEMSDRSQRFSDFGAKTLINYPSISLLTTNMPLDDPERYGRLKDLLPIILSGASSKLNVLHTQDALRDQSAQLVGSVKYIKGSLYNLGKTILHNRKASNLTLQDMIQELNNDLLRMGLEEQEEAYLIDRIDTSAEHALHKMDAGAEVRHAFSFVLDNLNHVLAQQNTMVESFETYQAQLQAEQEDDSNSGDIELF